MRHDRHMSNPPDDPPTPPSPPSAAGADDPAAVGGEARPGRPGRVPLRRRTPWAWFRLLRPIAALSAAAVVVGFAFILADGAPVWHEALRLGLAMFSVIAAASAMNDHLDRRHDRDAHIWRSLSADLISPRAAALFAAACMIAAFALSASLGWRACLPMLGGLACVGLYNLRLRRTPFSWLPFAIAFALVPPWVTEAVGRFDGYLWWALPVGALAGLTAHLAMKLPDYERDDVPGFQSLMHWMTIDYAVPMTWGFMGGFIVLAVASANFERLRIEWVAPPAAIAVVCTLAMMGVSFFGVSERKLVWQRWLFSLAIIGLAIGWLGSIVP